MRLYFRVLWVACGVSCWPVAAFAEDLPAVVANMRTCAAERDDAHRLACYDRQFRQGGLTPAFPDSAAAAGTPPAISPVSSHQSAVSAASGAGSVSALTPEQRFGMSPELERQQQGAASQPPQVDRLTGRIVAVSYKLHGEAVMTLGNGQVWEQADADSHVSVNTGDSISIRRGTLGSYWLSGPTTSSLRVRRVK
jgi:hypothetical protein